MKKNLLILVALSVVALPFLVSCGKKDPEKPAGVIVMQDPPTKAAAVKIEFPSQDLPKYLEKKTGGKYEIISIEFTESERSIIKRRVLEVPTKAAVGDIQVIVSSFTESGGKYTCPGFGTVTVSGIGSDVVVLVNPDDNEGYRSTNANVTNTPLPSSQDQNNADRNWKIENMSITVSGSVSFSHDFTGCDLNEIAKYAQGKGVNIDPDDYVGYQVKEFIFTGNNTFVINFTGTGVTAIGGTYRINESAKTISFSLPEGNKFFSGSINGSYDYPADKKMNLTLNASIKGYTGSMDFYMSQN
jgi:hypothetical protein